MTDRKFFKTTIVVEVLSEDTPIEFDNLAEVHHMVIEGDCSGQIIATDCVRLTGAEAAAELIKQGSDPRFFMLTDKGEAIES